MYDYAIIGAGINGAFTAHFLAQAGKRVLLIDKTGIASQGSGAAGAFLAPKIGKGGLLKSIVNDAYTFSINYYEKHFSHLLTQKGLLHLPKDSEDAALNFPIFKLTSEIEYSEIPEMALEPLYDKDLAKEGIFYPSSGLIEPDTLCRELVDGVDFLQKEITSLTFEADYYLLNQEIKAGFVILATGAFKTLVDAESIQLRPVWGERIEITSSTLITTNYHQNLSISATKPNGHIVIGATHRQNIYDASLEEANAFAFLEKAKALARLEDATLVDHRGGVRSGAFDYLPIIGRIVDEAKTLARFPTLLRGAKIDSSEFCYYPKLAMINGVGGRGFVLAPYLAHHLTQNLLHDIPLDVSIEPQRLFKRWAKKQGHYRNAIKEVK